ncbi:MAG: MerR family transcriptional regulator [Rhizobiaceae bacterium]
MKIGELAKVTGVSTSRIRFYESHGLLPMPLRQENGYRVYSEAIVSRLKTITVSKALGFSLSEIQGFLPDDPNDVIQRSDVVSNLENKLHQIDQKLKELQEMRENVSQMIAYHKDPNSKKC